MESKYNGFLTVLLIIIIVGIIGLLGYLGYDFFKSKNDDQDAAEFVQTFTDTAGDSQTNNDTALQDGNLIELNEVEGSGSSTKKKYKGFNVLGTIEIPKTDISYPILEKPTRKALEVSVAKLYPQSNDVINKPGNVVIVGHNYRNGRFFSNNKQLSNGDKIYITDLNGKKITYTVYKVFQAKESDTSFYNRDTKGAMEITLSTCTDDNSARTIILAKAE